MDDGGVLLIEEAHQLLSPTGNGRGAAALDYLTSHIEDLLGKGVFIVTGYGKQMDVLRGLNPAFRNMIPTVLHFPDLLDSQLHQLLIQTFKTKFDDNITVEGGLGGRYTRIVARRIGRGRVSGTFGNAREVQNMVNKIYDRQAQRVFQEEKARNHDLDRRTLTKDDLIGAPPSTALLESAAWKKLQEMIGLQQVKEGVKTLIDRRRINYDRELEERPLISCSLNKLFLGNPGTGKTTVAKLYGAILLDLGMLSSNEVVLKSPSDFIGDDLGASERNTKAILDATKGKILIIDEAYMLGGGGDRSNPQSDIYRSAVIDTIVAEVQSTAVEERCVLLLGYKKRMEAMLNEGNEAMARRFPLSSAFQFDNYSQNELAQISTSNSWNGDTLYPTKLSASHSLFSIGLGSAQISQMQAKST